MNNASEKLVNLAGARVGDWPPAQTKQYYTLFMSFNWINRPLNCVSIISNLLRGVCVVASSPCNKGARCTKKEHSNSYFAMHN